MSVDSTLWAGRALLSLMLVGCGPKAEPVVAPVPASTPAPVSAPAVAPPLATSEASPAAPSTTVAPETAASEAPGEAPWEGGASSNEPRLGDAVAMLTTRDAGRARSAIELLKPMSGEYPDVAAIPYNIGVAYHILNDETEARRAWLRATEVDPTFAKAWLNLGALSLSKGNAEAALSSFQAGIRQAPNDVDLRVAAISAQRALKRYPEAISEAKSALQVNSRAIELYNQLALVYIETGQIDLATFMCFKGLEAAEGAENNAQLQANFGTIYLKQGYVGDAVAAFDKALSLDQNQLTALQFLSAYHLDNRNYKAALPLLERTVGLLPNQAGARLNLGIALRGEGRFEEAIAAYNQALRIDPGNPEPHRNLAVLYGDYMKAYEQAISEIQAYRKNGGNQAGDLDAWIAQLQKDQSKETDRAAKKKKKEEDERKKREAAEAAAAAPVAPAPVEVAPVPLPIEVAPAPAPPAPESPAPAGGSDPNSPWGGPQ